MTTDHIAKAIERVRGVLGRRPAAGIHADHPATATWEQSLRTVTRHESGLEIATDLPAELGGDGGLPTPGWLLRASLASCAATRIAMEAAAASIVLEELAVSAYSTSDARGLLAMAGENGQAVSAAPTGLRLKVRVRAAGVSRERLETLIAGSCRCSPVTAALENAAPVAVEIDSEGG